MRAPYWNRQPVGGVRLRNDVPFTLAWSAASVAAALDIDGTQIAGLADCGRGGYELSLGKATDGGLGVIGDCGARAINFVSSTTNNCYVANVPTSLITGGTFSMLWVMRHRGFAGDGSLLSARTGGSGWLFQVKADNYYWYDDGNGNNALGGPPVTGRLITVLLTAINNKLELWANGVVATVTLGSTIATPGAAFLQIGAHSSTSGYLDSLIQMVAVGQRYAGNLAPALLRNPWQIFARQKRPALFGVTAGVTFNAAWNSAANTVISPGALTA